MSKLTSHTTKNFCFDDLNLKIDCETIDINLLTLAFQAFFVATSSKKVVTTSSILAQPLKIKFCYTLFGSAFRNLQN